MPSSTRFLLIAVGSIGDVYPYVGIGLALRRRGHHVFVVANPYYEKLIRDNRLEFVPVGTSGEQKQLLSHPKAWHPRTGWKVWLRMAARRPFREIYQAIADDYLRGRTVVAASWGGIGARIAQDKLGVPAATIHLEPDKFRSCYESSVMPAPMVLGKGIPRWCKRFQFWLADRRFIDRMLAPRINAFRDELGLPPVRRIMADWWHSPQCVIGMFPDWWAAPQPDWPAATVLTSFPFWDDGDDRQGLEEVASFLEQDDAPIVFSSGAINQQAEPFFRAAVDACRSLGRHGILLTKHPELLPLNLPEIVRHFEYVPFSQLLPRTAIMVHHAGIGTTAQCLAAGVPQLVTPIMHFHRDTARRLSGLGVGDSLAPNRANGRALSQRIAALLSSRQVADNCRVFASKLVNDRGIDRTCDILEKLVDTDPTPVCA